MTPILLAPEKVEAIAMASCSLHNYLRCTESIYVTLGCIDTEDTHIVQPGEWHQQPQPQGWKGKEAIITQ